MSLKYRSEIIVYIFFDLGTEINLNELLTYLETKKYVERVEYQETYVRYELWKKFRPLYVVFKLPRHGIIKLGKGKLSLSLDMRVYKIGVCSFRIKVRPEEEYSDVDTLIRIIRLLRFDEGRRKLLLDNISLAKFIDIIRGDIEQFAEKYFSREGINAARFEESKGYSMKYVSIRVYDIKPIVTAEQLIQEQYSYEIAGLITWHPEWRSFPLIYVKRMVSNPIPSRFRNSLILVKFPATLLYLPCAKERTWELYSIVIEHCKLEQLLYRIYSRALQRILRQLSYSVKSLRESLDKEMIFNIQRTIWELNMLKMDVEKSLRILMRMRELLPLHRLLMVYDELYKESLIAKERSVVEEGLKSLDLLTKDLFNILLIEYNRKRDEQARHFNKRIGIITVLISVLALWNVFSSICTLYAQEIRQFLSQSFIKIIPPLGILLGLVIILLYMKLKRL